MHLNKYETNMKLPSKSTALQKHDWASFICEMDASLNIQPKLIASVETVNTGLLTHRCPYATYLQMVHWTECTGNIGWITFYQGKISL